MKTTEKTKREEICKRVEKALIEAGATFTYSTAWGVYFKDEETGEHYQLDLRKPQ